MTPPRLLIVDPGSSAHVDLSKLGAMADVTIHADFAAARQYLVASSRDGLRVDFLVTNLRLGAYNGLHLVHLAAAQGLRARSIVYTDEREPGLGEDVRHAGAFYETRRQLAGIVAAAVKGTLPERDRRDAPSPDRRASLRGGRRESDLRTAQPDSTPVARPA